MHNPGYIDSSPKPTLANTFQADPYEIMVDSSWQPPERRSNDGSSGSRRGWLRRFTFLFVLSAIAAFTVWAWRSAPGSGSPNGRMQADSILATPVLASRVEIGSLQLFSEYPGELDADISDLASKIAGRLTEVAVRLGDRVAKGDLLARVDDSDLQRQYEEVKAQVDVAEANRLRVLAQLDEARSELGRLEELFSDGLISTGEIESARAAAAALEAELKAVEAQKRQSEVRVRLLAQQIDEARLRAPFNGVVAERYLHTGAFVQAGTPIVRLVKAGPLRVRFRIPEEGLAGVSPGARFKITTQSTQEQRFSGRVTRLSGEVNRRNRTVAVDGVLESTAPPLRPGMYAQVEMARGSVHGKIVPGAAVLKRVNASGDEINGVFTAVDGIARWRLVQVLGRQDDRIAVEGALGAEDRVLIFGHQDLTDGARISIVESSSEAPPDAG